MSAKQGLEGKATMETPVRAVPVPDVSRPIAVKFASSASEWEQAYQLVSSRYQACGYEKLGGHRLRFTPYHALPDTFTLVAKHQERVIATISIVQDNTLLGLPSESVYAEEINALRRDGYRLCEIGTMADEGLPMREFSSVFLVLSQLAAQYHADHGGDAVIINVNPRHTRFYTHTLGFDRLGPPRPNPAIQNHLCEELWLNKTLLRKNASRMYEFFLKNPLPREALLTPIIPDYLVRQFSAQSSLCDPNQIEKILALREQHGSMRRW